MTGRRPPVEEGAALFEQDGDRFVPSSYAQGPWDPRNQFGGSPAALLATLVEQVPSLVPMQVGRLTVDLLRPVPLAPLTADVRIIREGKRIQVIAASLFSDDIEVVRSSALRIRESELPDGSLPDSECPNPLPSEPRLGAREPFPLASAHGSRLAVEYLFEDAGGHYSQPTWVRLLVGIIAAQPTSPLARLAYTADLASGIGERTGMAVRGINADVAINVIRYPEGEWLCLDGRGWTSRTGIGQVQATLSDQRGMAATVSMARLVDLVPD